jgi:hypothetical protein
MFEISNIERLVLLALDKGQAQMTEMRLVTVTGLDLKEVQDSLACLVKLGRARQVFHGSEPYHVSTTLSSQPIFPNWQELLGAFCAEVPPFEEGDTLATMYVSCGVVLLAAIVGGTRDEATISRATMLPIEFVMLVLGMAERQGVLSLDAAFDLQGTIRKRSHDFDEVEQSLDCLKEHLWEFCWTPGIEVALNNLRNGRQFGGAVDLWVNEEALERPLA